MRSSHPSPQNLSPSRPGLLILPPPIADGIAMLDGKKVIVVMPAYNAARTLLQTYAEVMEHGFVDRVIVVDDASRDETMAIAKTLPSVLAHRHERNQGYGANQKTCYRLELSEYHTGYRAYSRELLERLPLDANSDDFVFDNQVLAQSHWLGYVIAEVTCPTKYFPEGSSINFRRSVRYGLGCLKTGLQYRLARMGVARSKCFPSPR